MNREELRRTFVLANEFKEGDLLVGGTRDDGVRAEARTAVAAVNLEDITPHAFVEDGVSEALARGLDRRRYAEIEDLTLADLKRILLSARGADWAHRYRDALPSEAIAGVVKVMSNDELSLLARRLFNPLPGDGVAIGSPQHFGSRIQPNSPGDDDEEILFSVLEGLTYGCGDVILGLNPASDELDTITHLEELLQRIIQRLQLPTRYCVLSDMVKQHRARERAAVDVGFQSLAGTSRALTGMIGLDVDALVDLARAFSGLYFETGQGSAVTNGTAEGVDMVTLESRAYGLARYIRARLSARGSDVPHRRSPSAARTGMWMIVNDVAGFIGPEVFRSVEQLERACLEDTVMAKLHGLTMGLDVCATFHMGIAPVALEKLTASIVERAAPAYLMAVAGNADPMLGYLTTSFREHPRLRRRTGRQMTSAMRQRLADLSLLQARGDVMPTARDTAALYAMYTKRGGDSRTSEALVDEGLKIIDRLQQRGYDIGYAYAPNYALPSHVEQRLESIYAHARLALYAVLDEALVADVCPRHIRVRTNAADREEYLAHPHAGERIRDDDARAMVRVQGGRRPQVQIVLSDGLNAHGLNENLRATLRPLRYSLKHAGFHLADVDVVVTNGRVRAGYHVGALMDPDVVIHFIGERPGTGLNTASAYITYGRDAAGASRWTPDLDHSCTTAVCGIHARGRPPDAAAAEIVRTVARVFDERCSGVALGKA